MQSNPLLRKPAQNVGDFISYDYYRYLVEGFGQKHPTEERSVFVPREYILETLDRVPHVSGLRFVYGLKEGDDVTSRTVVLMACDDTSTDRILPNLILVPKGYLTHTGERLSIDRCWELFDNYVNRMCALMPEAPRKEIPRACFYGIESLKSLLGTAGCAGIRLHFGYNPSTELLPQRYEVVLEAVDNDRQSLNVYMEIGGLCPPPACDFDSPGEMMFNLGFKASRLLEETADGALYEMYNYVTPTLTEAIRREGLREADVYIEQFSECAALMTAGKKVEATVALRQALDAMMAKYLFN